MGQTYPSTALHQPERRVTNMQSPVETQRLSATNDGIRRAADLLARGELVAFPTETVYGLGADARNDRTVARIYEAKGRPSFNPLIVHVPDIETAKRYVQWDKQAELVAQFWPGPLTLVLPLKSGSDISKLVTAGLDTLAIRVPENPTAQALLRQFAGPVAAPSANPSGQISPTTADHVLNGLSGRIAAVVDAGPCRAGLESTILGLANTPTLLRPGPVTRSDLAECLGMEITAQPPQSAISAPGQLASHYAPNAAVRLNATTWRPDETRLGFGSVDCDLNLSPSGNLTEAAANLFAYLHKLDASGAEKIAVSPIPETGLGRAINDRLTRAAAPRP